MKVEITPGPALPIEFDAQIISQPSTSTPATVPPVGLVEIITTSPFFNTIISDTPPPNPIANQLWWESDTGVLWIWYDDGDSKQWVEVANAGGSPGAGSGGDADTLDGHDSTYFATQAAMTTANANIATNTTNITTNTTNIAANTTAIGTKLNSSAYTAADVLAKLVTVDGTGSGLDADRIDGVNITVASSAPSSPAVNDVWIDTT